MTAAEQLAATWSDMGFIRWPLIFSFLVVVVLALWSAIKLFRPHATPDLQTKAWPHWGWHRLRRTRK